MPGMFRAILNFSILALALPLSALATNHGHLLNRRHADLAKRSTENTTLLGRAAGSRWSYYDTQTGNAGSCGKLLSNSGFTVAMNAATMNSGLCWKTIRMSYNGKSTTAVIEDTCPGCPYNGLDLTPSLFGFFAPLGAGIIYGEWEFADAAPPPPPYTPPTPTPPPYTPPPPQTTTSVWVAPKPTTTPTPTPSPTPSSSSIPSPSIKYSSSAASGLAAPSGTSSPPSADNLEGMNQAFIKLGGLILSGNQLSS